MPFRSSSLPSMVRRSGMLTPRHCLACVSGARRRSAKDRQKPLRRTASIIVTDLGFFAGIGDLVPNVLSFKVALGGVASPPIRNQPALAPPEHSRGLAVSFADRDLLLQDRGSSARTP